jgi:hypothetical protein
MDARRKENRRDIAVPEIDPLANSWQSGRTLQLVVNEMDMRRREVEHEA